MAVIRNEARLALRSQGKYLLNKRHSPIRENARLNKKAHFSRLITKPAFVCLRKPNGKKLAQVYLGRVYYLSILIFKQPPLVLGWLKSIPDSVTRLGAIWKLLAINFLTKKPKYLVTCWSSPEMKNCSWFFFGNFWKHLGYFLFQYLVTLILETKGTSKAGNYHQSYRTFDCCWRLM